MAENNIVGISGYMDISDVINPLTELYNRLVKLNNVSKDTAKGVEQALKELGTASEKEMEGKTRNALQALVKAFDEAKGSTQSRINDILSQLKTYEEEITRIKTRTLSLGGKEMSFDVPRMLLDDDRREYYDELISKIGTLRQELETLAAQKEKYKAAGDNAKEIQEIDEMTKRTHLLTMSDDELRRMQKELAADMESYSTRLSNLLTNNGLAKQGDDAKHLAEMLHEVDIQAKAVEKELAKRTSPKPEESKPVINVGGSADDLKKITSSVNELKSGVGALGQTATGTFSGMSGGLTKLLQLGGKFGPWGAAIAAAIGAIAAASYGLYKIIKALSDASQKLYEAMLPLKAYVDKDTFGELRKSFTGGNGDTSYIDRVNTSLSVMKENLTENAKRTTDLDGALLPFKQTITGTIGIIQTGVQAYRDFSAALEESARGIRLHAQTSEDMAKAALVWVRYYDSIRNSPKAIMSLVEASNELATITGWSSEKATQSLAKMAGAFHLTAFEAKASVNMIVTAVKESTYTYDDFVGAMTNSATRAMQVGVSFKDLAGAIKAGSKEYTSASTAASNFIMVMQRLVNTHNDKYNPATQGAAQALRNFNKDVKSGEASMSIFIKNQRNIAEYFLRNADSLDKFSASMYDATNKNMALASAEEKAEYHVKLLENAWDDLKKEFNVNITPAINKIIDALAVSIQMLGVFANKIGDIINSMEPYLNKLPMVVGLLQHIPGMQGTGLWLQAAGSFAQTTSENLKTYKAVNEQKKKIEEMFNAEVGAAMLAEPKADRAQIVDKIARQYLKKIMKYKGALNMSEYSSYIEYLRNTTSDLVNAQTTTGGDNTPFKYKDKNAEREAKERAKREEQRILQEWDFQEQLNQARRKAQEAGEDAYLAGITDEGRRERETRRIQYERTKRDLEQQQKDLYKAIWEQRKKEYENAHKDGHYELTPEGQKGWQNGITPKNDNERQLLEEGIKEIEALRRKNETENNNANKKEQEAREQSMREYLQKYGSFQEKILAIKEDYSKRIEKVKDNPWEVKALEKERDREIGRIKLDELKEEINWDAVFGNLDVYTKKALTDVRALVREYLKLNKDNLDAEQIKIIQEALTNLDRAIIDKSGLFAGLSESMDAYRKAVEELTEAEKEYQEAVKTYGENSAQAEEARKKMNQAQSNVNNAQGNVNKNEQNTMNKLTLLTKSLVSIGKSTDMSLTDIGNVTGELIGALSESGSATGSLVAAILSLLDAIGEMGLDHFIGNVLDNVAHAVGGIFKGVGNILGSIVGDSHAFDFLDDVFGDGYSNYKKAKAEYDELLNVWESLISKKEEYLNKKWGTEATEAKEEALQLLQAEKEATKIIAQERLDAGASMGSHSMRYRMWEGSYDYNGQNWRDVAKEISQSLGGVKFDNMDDLLNMSSEQLLWIKENYIGLWSKMDTDFREYLEKLIEYGDREEKILSKEFERITGMTKESVFDDFLNSLYELADGSEDVFNDIAESWQKMVNRMVINNLIGSKYKDDLEQWAADLRDLQDKRNKGEISPEEYEKQLKDLYDRYNRLIRDAQADINEYREAGIIKNPEQQQSATANSIQNISYDQADSLIGIETAQMIVLENILAQSQTSTEIGTSLLDYTGTIAVGVENITENVAMILEAQNAANLHLANISANTSVLPEMSEILGKIKTYVEQN